MTTSFEELFNKCVLSVVAPRASLGLIRQKDAPNASEEWLNRLEDEATDRKMAFFDENLDFLLILRFAHPLPDPDGDEETTPAEPDPTKPPVHLLSFLAHLQVSYEAAYIAPLAQPPPQSPLPPPLEVSLNEPSNRKSMPPRSQSIPIPSRLGTKHPSIFPPHTPHPVPSAAESDRQYVQAQGTPLRSGIWGDGPGAESDAFLLLWSPQERAWIALFKMSVAVSFMPTKVPDPLLCLTVSATLRDKPVPVTPPRQSLAAMIEAAGGLASPIDAKSPGGTLENGDGSEDLTGLEEVNLFEGLTIGTTFSSDDPDSSLVLPSTRLGASVRRTAFSLPSPTSTASSPLPSSTLTPSTSRTSYPTLRKSFRKTLQTVSGFRVRMRTVFVPYFMLPQPGTRKPRKDKAGAKGASDSSDEDDMDPESIHERELREAGAEEHTVILCVEVENSGESSAGFAVESVKVTVGGEGAQTRLIGWGESASEEPESIFPLLIGPEEQYNLLYAVAFMRSPETDEFSLARRSLPGVAPAAQLQRAVTIILNGRPYEQSSTSDDSVNVKDKHKTDQRSYPTQTFPSRWNCILDLSAQVPGSTPDLAAAANGRNDALPTPASPFPLTAPRGNFSRPGSMVLPQTSRPRTPGSGASTPVTAVAGNKRFTLSAIDRAMESSDSPRARTPASPMNYRSDTSLLNPTNQRDMLAQSGMQSPSSSTPVGGLSPNLSQNRSAYIPPSLTVPTFNRTPVTTYGPLSPSQPPIPRTHSFAHMQEDSMSSPISYEGVPPTPAYPAFPASPTPTTPHWQGPIASLQSGEVGPTVEIPREKRQTMPGIPPTPGPRVGAGGGFVQMQAKGEAALRGTVSADGPQEPIVVSVGVLQRDEAEGGSGSGSGSGKIYPLDQFTLDIFVFNRSSWTRRFEISYPDRRKQRKDRIRADDVTGGKNATDLPGVLALENRVRIGPLLPSTCQSVRMDFMALTPGVHSIDVLTMTDIQSGFVMNLRSVLDVVVHEHEPPVKS